MVTPVVVTLAESMDDPSEPEPINPVGAILDALPEQILAWYRPEEVDPEVQAATDLVLDGLGDSLLDHFRASQGPAEPEPGEILDKPERIAA